MGWPNHYSVLNYRLVPASKSSGVSVGRRWPPRRYINMGVPRC